MRYETSQSLSPRKATERELSLKAVLRLFHIPQRISSMHTAEALGILTYLQRLIRLTSGH